MPDSPPPGSDAPLLATAKNLATIAATASDTKATLESKKAVVALVGIVAALAVTALTPVIAGMFAKFGVALAPEVAASLAQTVVTNGIDHLATIAETYLGVQGARDFFAAWQAGKAVREGAK